ncbi:hypothetical protein [Flavobacterium sp. AG291]|uniref:hypothetical protein n=1 Tax=Flavobacterium sp. AG291 TaxID=2184000 RepID=UPI000E0B8F16|nr:hypothetical protein [Flavobacterium sp. AG291]RDI05388.1 hypothetical protein DEU42_11861 [Flavobacterium sp. AG291]
MAQTISKSNQIQLHYYFTDNTHGFDAIVRNECEKELLNLYYDVAKTLGLNVFVQSEPPQEGGFIEIWKFIGENTNQITIIVSAIAIILSRRPVENKKLTQLQIENLEIENELKKNELRELQLKKLTESDINEDTIRKVVELLSLNYRVIWRRSNFYKKVIAYKRIHKVSEQRLFENSPIGADREITRNEFSNFVLSTDDLPDNEIVEASIDLISPVLKSGNFLWKGFYNNDIISFQMQDDSFRAMIQNGEMILNNKVTLNTVLLQSRRIDEDGHIKITKSIVTLVIDYSINGVKHITKDGQIYLDS